MNKCAVFINLDSLIETKSGREYPLHSKDFRIINDTAKYLKQLPKEVMIIVLSNQGHIGLLVDEGEFIKKIEYICNDLEVLISRDINSIAYCYSVDKKSYHYMPNPGMVFECAIDYELNIRNSMFVGTSMTDKQTALNSGITLFIDILDIDIEE